MGDNLRIPKIFLAKQHLKKVFLQRFLAKHPPQKNPFPKTVNCQTVTLVIDDID